MQCYITGASLTSPDLKRIVLVFTDVFGYEAGNHRLFSDVLAKRLGGPTAGTTAVLVPDLFRGNPICQPLPFLPDALGLMATLPAFLYRMRFNHPPQVVERDLTELILPWIQSQVPNVAELGISCVGFCFGGWIVARSLALDNFPMKCGVGVHPSFMVESAVHWGNESDLVAKIGPKPILLLPAGNDSNKIKVGGSHTKALAEMRNVPETIISMEFPNMKHGWVSRGDGTDAAVAECQEEAMEAVSKFLEQNHV